MRQRFLGGVGHTSGPGGGRGSRGHSLGWECSVRGMRCCNGLSHEQAIEKLELSWIVVRLG